jgi:hypothetical protein
MPLSLHPERKVKTVTVAYEVGQRPASGDAQPARGPAQGEKPGVSTSRLPRRCQGVQTRLQPCHDDVRHCLSQHLHIERQGG